MRRGAVEERVFRGLKWIAVGLLQVECTYLLFRAITKGEAYSSAAHKYVSYADHPITFVIGIVIPLTGFLGCLVAFSTILPGKRPPMVDHRRITPPMDKPEFTSPSAIEQDEA